jgi:hypothetical protein
MYDFRRSEWFERGWTLQELLAPRCVIFVTSDWQIIGRKSPVDHDCVVSASSLLNQTISQVTHIPENILYGFESRRDSVSDSVKMAWAANRSTTKAEDVAYCLLGIFGVHMPLIYGEGEFNARKRLQQEIKKKAEEREDPDFWFPINPATSGSPPHVLMSASQSGNSSGLSTRNARQREDLGPSRAAGRSSYSHTTTPNTENVIDRSDVDMSGTSTSFDTTGFNNVNSVVHEDELCPKCKNIPLEPITSTCGHSFCATCMADSENKALVLVFEPLELDGHARGEAMIENFGRPHPCPVCGVLARFYHDIAREKQLQQAWPLASADRAEHGSISNDVAGIITITMGNWHELVAEHKHHWSFFVKPNRTDVISEVHFHLHESFEHPHKIMKKPPYMIHCKGWGFFTIEIDVILKAGFAWVSENARPGLDGAQDSLLRLEWTIDFVSYKGRGSQGKCRVKVRRIQ